MKKALLATTAILGAGVATTPAFAADGIKLSLGGFFNTAVEENIDNHHSGDLGNDHYNDGVYSDAEIYFMGQTTLDNGLTVGARVELEGEQSDDQIDAAYVFFQGGFGELRVGSQYGAMEAMCVTPVGGTTNFGAFSQYQVINNAFGGFSAGICNTVDSYMGNEHSQKIVYITPDFGGFQLGLSWSPNGGHESSGVTDFHSGQPATDRFEQRNIVDAYATFNHDFDGWSLAWGGGGSWAVTEAGPSQGGTKGAFYQTGLNLTFGDLGVGGAFEYYKNGLVFAQSSALPGTGEAAGDVDSVIPHQDMWVAGGGVSYKIDATTLGLQYSYSDMEGLTTANANRYIHTVALTANYDLGPGIAINGALEYVRADGQHDDDAHNGYNSVGLGLGTSFTF